MGYNKKKIALLLSGFIAISTLTAAPPDLFDTNSANQFLRETADSQLILFADTDHSKLLPRLLFFSLVEEYLRLAQMQSDLTKDIVIIVEEGLLDYVDYERYKDTGIVGDIDLENRMTNGWASRSYLFNRLLYLEQYTGQIGGSLEIQFPDIDIDESRSQGIWDEPHRTYINSFFQEREGTITRNISTIMEKYPNRKIFCLYGGAHLQMDSFPLDGFLSLFFSDTDEARANYREDKNKLRIMPFRMKLEQKFPGRIAVLNFKSDYQSYYTMIPIERTPRTWNVADSGTNRNNYVLNDYSYLYNPKIVDSRYSQYPRNFFLLTRKITDLYMSNPGFRSFLNTNLNVYFPERALSPANSRYFYFQSYFDDMRADMNLRARFEHFYKVFTQLFIQDYPYLHHDADDIYVFPMVQKLSRFNPKTWEYVLNQRNSGAAIDIERVFSEIKQDAYIKQLIFSLWFGYEDEQQFARSELRDITGNDFDWYFQWVDWYYLQDVQEWGFSSNRLRQY